MVCAERYGPTGADTRDHHPCPVEAPSVIDIYRSIVLYRDRWRRGPGHAGRVCESAESSTKGSDQQHHELCGEERGDEWQHLCCDR